MGISVRLSFSEEPHRAYYIHPYYRAGGFLRIEEGKQ